MTPVFGEFLDLAGQQIAAATLPRGKLPGDARDEIIGELDRLVTAMARYANDHVLPGAFHPAAPAEPTADEQAADGARVALIHAAGNLTLAARATTYLSTSATNPAADHLRAAADALAAGRDLLQTHFAPGSAIPLAAYSPWAPVIASLPVTSALVDELTRYARQLAPLAAQMSLPAHARLPAARGALRAASRWLQVAGSPAVAATRQHDWLEAGRELLRAIPSNMLPPRHLPSGAETVAELCSGATGTTDRLRYLALRFARQSRWPPAATATCWRRNALATAIVGHNSELILQALADRAAQLSAPATDSDALRRAAGVMRRAWTSWQAVANAWDPLSTGTARGLSPVAAELGDLVLWIGRLAHNHPGWTPARGGASRTRDPADLAPTASDIKAVLTVIERAADVVGQITQQDKHNVGQIAAEHGLYIPTRLLPEKPGAGYLDRYGHAPRSRTTGLLTGYQTAVTATEHAAVTLNDLVIRHHAPPAALSAVRAASLSSPVTARHPGPSTKPPPPPPTTGAARARRPDELEHLVRGLEITEPALLLRAAAIDRATSDLIAEATEKTQRLARAHEEAHPKRAHPTGGARAQAAQLASQDLPRTANGRTSRDDHDQLTITPSLARKPPAKDAARRSIPSR